MSTGPARPPRRRGPGRARRRADAPATNPDADPGDDLPTTTEDDRGDGPPPTADPRDEWIAEQRPPHWD